MLNKERDCRAKEQCRRCFDKTEKPRTIIFSSTMLIRALTAAFSYKESRAVLGGSQGKDNKQVEMFTNKKSITVLAASSGVRRRLLLGVLAVSTASLSRQALSDTSPADATAAITHLNEALLATMKSAAQTDFSRRFDALAPVVDQTFDLCTVLAMSVGSGWSSLPADQRSRLLEVFRRYTVATYVANFDGYNGQTFSVLSSPRSLDAGRMVVHSSIIANSGETTELDYVMQPTLASWKVVDVLAAGSISRVAVQRSDFRRLLSQGGGEALLSSLQHKTSQLSGGRLA